MLTEKQIHEIREHLEKAQNPVFYFDNDADGLCSFLILRRFAGRGYGVAIRSYPELNARYADKARQLNADYIFILDKPVVSPEFLKKIDEIGLPLVWIDHHDVLGEEFKKEFAKFENFYIFNPALNKGNEKSNEPVSYLAQKIAGRKEDIWIAFAGCIADSFMPDFADEFAKKHSSLFGNAKKPFEAYYKTEIGKIAQAFNFGLKDKTANVVKMQNFLISCRGPEDVLTEGEKNKEFLEKNREIRKKYDVLLEEAESGKEKKSIFFEYAGALSISSDIANELSYKYPKKYIAVAYKKAGITNISMRGENVREVLLKILPELENARGGGHMNAVGARIKTDDLKRFRELFEKQTGEKNE